MMDLVDLMRAPSVAGPARIDSSIALDATGRGATPPAGIGRDWNDVLNSAVRGHDESDSAVPTPWHVALSEAHVKEEKPVEVPLHPDFVALEEAKRSWQERLSDLRAQATDSDEVELDPARASELADQREAVRGQVEELVARTFIAPILASMRENPLKSDLFPETPGTKALAPIVEAEVAKSMAKSMGGGFVEDVARRLLENLSPRVMRSDVMDDDEANVLAEGEES